MSVKDVSKHPLQKIQYHTPPTPHRLRRLVILDGFNILRARCNLIDGRQSPCDSKMDALILLPIIRSLVKQEFRVRIVLKRLPKPFEISNMFIIDELRKMNLLIYPAKDFLEADDKIMLEIADKYGAAIISNDSFGNHPEYQAVAKTNTIKFKKERNPRFSLEELQRQLIFENKLKLDACSDDMHCSQGGPDYEKVKESNEIFWSLTKLDNHVLDCLWDYAHCLICSQVGIQILPLLKFWKEDDESYPKKFEAFKNNY